jgi:leucyl/phenylalanyl-tRNA--protein transferase
MCVKYINRVRAGLGQRCYSLGMTEPDTSNSPDNELTPELVVRAYCAGAFPMADGRDGTIQWFSPDPRAVIPLEEDGFLVPRSLRKRVRSDCYRVTKDRAFEEVIRACAQPRADDADTWINPRIVEVYCELHNAGLAHSVEAWAPGSDQMGSCQPYEKEVLVGGLYGVSLGGAFFGESMFHRATDASKVCLVALVEHLRARGFGLLDVQFVNPHLEQFGVKEISSEAYMTRLHAALESGAMW